MVDEDMFIPDIDPDHFKDEKDRLKERTPEDRWEEDPFMQEIEQPEEKEGEDNGFFSD